MEKLNQYRFFTDNIKLNDNRPRTKDEVRVYVIDNLNILFDGQHLDEEYINNVTNIVCNHLNINE